GRVGEGGEREQGGIDKRDGHSKEREQAGQTRQSWASSVGSKNSIRERRQRSPRRNAAGGLVTTAAQPQFLALHRSGSAATNCVRTNPCSEDRAPRARLLRNGASA